MISEEAKRQDLIYFHANSDDYRLTENGFEATKVARAIDQAQYDRGFELYKKMPLFEAIGTYQGDKSELKIDEAIQQYSEMYYDALNHNAANKTAHQMAFLASHIGYKADAHVIADLALIHALLEQPVYDYQIYIICKFLTTEKWYA